jgi:hypothetical protein
VSERQNRCFWTDRDIASRANLELPAVKQTAEINDIPLPKKNFSAIKKPAPHLDSCIAT